MENYLQQMFLLMRTSSSCSQLVEGVMWQLVGEDLMFWTLIRREG
jgi:hypothetical protein